MRDVLPGEIVTISPEKGIESDTSHVLKPADTARCIFEYIYFARPDSFIDGISVYDSRILAGKFLAMDSPVDADLVIAKLPPPEQDAFIFSNKGRLNIRLWLGLGQASVAGEKKEKTAGQPESTSVPVKPVCPICKKGSILRGKTAYGCSEYKDGCTFRMDYATYGEGLSDEELVKVISGIGKD